MELVEADDSEEDGHPANTASAQRLEASLWCSVLTHLLYAVHGSQTLWPSQELC